MQRPLKPSTPPLNPIKKFCKTEQEKQFTATSYKDILSTIRLTKAAHANKIKPANGPAFTPKSPTASPVEKPKKPVVLTDDKEKESSPETETRSPKSAGGKTP